MSEHKSDLVSLSGEDKKKWYGQQVGVNSDVPLVDAGTGVTYVLRQFEFAFDPEMLRKIKQKKIPVPTNQDLFNSNWNQIRIMLWTDGMVAVQENEFPPRIIVGKRKYKIILVCQPRAKVMVADKVNTLQDILKPKRLTNKT